MAVSNERFGIDVILDDSKFQSGMKRMMSELGRITTESGKAGNAGKQMGQSFSSATTQMGGVSRVTPAFSNLRVNAEALRQAGGKLGGTFSQSFSQMAGVSKVSSGMENLSRATSTAETSGNRLGGSFSRSFSQMAGVSRVTSGMENLSRSTNSAETTGRRLGGTFSNSFSQMAGVSRVTGGMENLSRAANSTGESGTRMGRSFSEALSRMSGNQTGQASQNIRSVGQASSEASDHGKKMGSTFADTFKAMLGAQAVVTAFQALSNAVKGAVGVGMEYTQQMSKVEAISGSTSVQMAELGSNARKLGADTRWSATNVAEAYEYMAMAGWNSNQMLDASLPLLNLATAGALDLGRAADIVTDTMTPFGLAASEAGRVADVFAVAQSKANLNVGMLGETMKYAAPIAATFGASLEETTVVAMQFANGGIKASMAGTALRAGLSRLAEPPKPAAKALAQLGVQTTKTDGTMKSLRDIVGELAPKFNALTNQQQVAAAKAIFGEEAYAGWVMVLKNGLPEFDKLEGLLKDSSGAADVMAKVMANNLSGAMDNAKSAAENLGLILFSRIEGGLTAATNGTIGWMSSLSQTLDPMNNVVEATKLLQQENMKYNQSLALIEDAKAKGKITDEDYNEKKRLAAELLQKNTSEAGILQQKMAELDQQLASGALNQEQYNQKKQEAEVFSKNMGTAVANEKKHQEELGKKIEWLQGIFQQLWKVVEPLWKDMSKFIGDKISEIKKFIDENGKEIEAVWKVVWGVIKFFTESIWSGIKDIINGALDLIMGVIKVFGGLLTGDWEKVWEGVKQILSGAVDLIWGIIQVGFGNFIKAPLKFGKEILEWAGKTFSKLLDDIGKWLSKLPSEGGKWFGDMLKKIGSVLKDVKEFVLHPFDTAKKALDKLDWSNIGKNLMQSLINGITGMATRLISEVGKVGSYLNPLKWFSSPDTPIGKIGGGQRMSPDAEFSPSAISSNMLQAPSGIAGLSQVLDSVNGALSSLSAVGSAGKRGGNYTRNVAPAPAPQSQGGQITIEVPVYLDKYQIASATGEVNQTELNRLESRKRLGSGGSKYF
ncbi:phage tail tape measure protein [Bacillus cereus group sp. TH153LC]|uniref:phage tail tape measure protein n=1 Tax=Bacillus cereus group sp. TH153LC TaxID=3018059 RepID=UPI0022E23908|nr:phage tail tape measure protein [Bacillus cereus group sp. TH153LC]MDA1658825.1 phage tail tape measure protein [Bacillus cereus group sp. TH153LC]